MESLSRAGSGIRTFISLEIPEETQAAVGRLQSRLKSCGADVRWTAMPGLHLTLKFLGPVSETRLPRIAEALSPVAAQQSRFQIRVAGVAAFPTLGNPRVLWIGCEPMDRLLQIHKRVEDALVGQGFEPETRPFQPHLTLGRVRSSRGIRELRAALEAVSDWSAGECELTALYLMKSDLRPGGAVYSTLWSRTFTEQRND